MNRSVSLLATSTCVTMLLLNTAACQAAPVVLGICTHEADRQVRYPGDDDGRYWNMVLSPLGCRILHEGNFDRTRQYFRYNLVRRTAILY